MRRWQRVLVGFLALVLLVLVGGYWYQRPLLLTGTGYAAHNDCAVREVAGRDNPEADLPPNPLVPVLEVDDGGESVKEASVLGLWAKQQVWYTPGWGCSVGESAPDLPQPLAVPNTNSIANAPTPTMGADLSAAVADAFGDNLSDQAREARGTRAILVLKDGELIAERYAEGFDQNTRQLGWSMTKSVTSLLVGRLVAEGKISLNDDQLRPEWKDNRADITFEHLLRMTSGLAWDETYALGTPVTQMLYGEEDMGNYVASLPAEHNPGEYQEYSTGNTQLVCDILRDQLSVDANLPREFIFQPLGLSSAVIEPDASGTPVCGSYMWASPRDWAAIAQFALQEGEWEGEKLLPEGWMQLASSSPQVKTQDEGYGMGFWINTLPDGSVVYPELPPDAYFAEGHDGQWLVIVPSAKLVVVRLGFSPEVEFDDVGATQLAADVLKILATEGTA
jgi:CubicO group peptidase (beta-lactamase class C family)